VKFPPKVFDSISLLDDLQRKYESYKREKNFCRSQITSFGVVVILNGWKKKCGKK
jgi:hypothetical protein